MHFDILVEDFSGKVALDTLVPKIIGSAHTFDIKAYKGIGRLPRGLKPKSDASKRVLLDQLPKLLSGYGKTYANYPSNYMAAVIVVCDLDDKCLDTFKKELLNLLASCSPAPETRFCIAIEEGESWFLGDHRAILEAYPKAKKAVLHSYVYDSICGAWETLADVTYPGGSSMLKKMGWPAIGIEKSKWAEEITPHMNINNNQSASFCYFRDKLKELVGTCV